MFYMLSAFNLDASTDVEDFRKAVEALDAHLKDLGLIESTGPLGRRVTDTILDTDDERGQEYFFINTFKDRAQSDRAIAYVQETDDPRHKAVYAQVSDPVFTCWEDID